MSIEAEWEKIKERVIANDAPLIQVYEMKKAFYMGVSCILSMTSDLAVSSMSEEESDKHFQSIMDEVNEYFSKTIENEYEEVLKNGR